MTDRIRQLEDALRPFADLEYAGPVDEAWQANGMLDVTYRKGWSTPARLDPADIKRAARVLRMTKLQEQGRSRVDVDAVQSGVNAADTQ